VCTPSREQIENEREVMNAANSWCKMSMTGATMKRDMMLWLEEYEK
jgi:hypothetical protein